MAPRTRKAKQADQLKITVDGNAYTLDLLGSTTVDRLELYRQSGLTMPEVVKAFENRQYETFFVAALVFLARRQMNTPASFMAIADAIGWDSEIDMETLASSESEDDNAPKEPETSTDGEPQS